MDTAQFEQPQVKSSPYASPMNNFSGSIIFLTNPDNELFKLEMTLRNMVMGKEGEPRSVGKPLLNDEGVSSVVGQVQAIVNQVTVMSNLEPEEIPRLVDFLADTLARDLMINRGQYNIENGSSRDKIYFGALTSAFICMKRANEEGERRFWKGSQQEITTRVDGLQGRKGGGLLGKMLGWAGGK